MWKLVSLTALAGICACTFLVGPARAGEKPKLFPPLRYESPIAVFASKAKTLVLDDGSVQQLVYSREPQGHNRERKNGPLLRISLLGHPPETAERTQRYTEDATPTIETVYRWPDATLALTAFAADPEPLGCFVRAEVTNSGSSKREFQIDIHLGNSEVQPVPPAGLVDNQGRVLLRFVPVARGENAIAWQASPGSPTTVKAVLSVDASAKAALAVQMPVDNAPAVPFAEALEATHSTWRSHWEGGIRLSVPDSRFQAAWEANQKQLGMMLSPQADGLRIMKGFGRYHGSNPYDTLQGSLILDRLGRPDLAEALLRRQLKRVRPDGLFEMWEEAVPPTRPPDQWIVQGLATFAMWKHYEMIKDRRWLEEIAPVVLRSAKATMRGRRKPSANGTQGGLTIRGFVPPGFGDGGIPNGYTLPQNFGPLTGILVAAKIADVLGMPEKATLDREYEEYRGRILDVMRASVVKAGPHSVVPSFPGAGPDHVLKHLWGTVEGVYPFGVVAPDDPLVLGTLRFLQSTQKHGQHLNLGYSEGVWPYMSASIAHWHLRLGEYDEAFRILQAILDHASPTWGWYEEIEHDPPKGHADIPDVWATCELLHTTRELLVFEKGDALLLSAAIPESWMAPGKRLSVEDAPTTLGKVSYWSEWEARKARAVIRLDPGAQPTEIQLRLAPDASKAKFTVTGATLKSSDARFVHLAALTGEIQVQASW